MSKLNKAKDFLLDRGIELPNLQSDISSLANEIWIKERLSLSCDVITKKSNSEEFKAFTEMKKSNENIKPIVEKFNLKFI